MVAKVVLLLAVMGMVAAKGAGAEEFNPLVGKVGDFALREVDLERLLATQSPELQKQFRDNPEKKVLFVKQLLTVKAVSEKARKEGFDRRPEVKEQLSYVVDNVLFREYLSKVVVANITVPEEDLKKFHTENQKELLLPAEIKVRHIFFAVKKGATAEERTKANVRAEETLLRVRKGEDFAKLARELSEDEGSAKKGGELGSITAGGEVAAFEKAAFALKAGETSEVVESSYGYHLIRVDERKEERQATYEEAKEFIRTRLQADFEQKKVQEFIEKVTQTAGLEVKEEKLVGTREPQK